MMKNNLKIKINDIINAIKKRKSFIILKNTRANYVLAQFFRIKGFLSNFCFDSTRKNLILNLSYDSYNNSAISSFVLNKSKKNKHKKFLNRNISRLQANNIINASGKDKTLVF